MDPRIVAAALADLPDSVAQEAGEFYENFAPGRKPAPRKAEAMLHAWQEVIRPYLLGKRDHYPPQRRPDDASSDHLIGDHSGCRDPNCTACNTLARLHHR